MGTRRNISTNVAARDAFIQGVLALKAENSGFDTAQLQFILHPSGVQTQQLSTWDLFTLWHVMAMNERQGSGRNAAHSGPTFLPWHRWFLLLLEWQFQRVLGAQNFGLPYWDWAADGDQPVPQQRQQPLWTAQWIGGDGAGPSNSVTSGPFQVGNGFRVHIEGDNQRRIWATNRALQRTLGRGVADLPMTAQVSAVLNQANYDEPTWNAFSADGLRNRLEGWAPRPTMPHLHNRVHVWTGGDMGPATSPNDPVFFLNHCNVDRIWAGWQARPGPRPYVPTTGSAAELFRHRRNDPLYSVLTSFEPRINQVLNVTQFYDYDVLP